MSSNLSTNTIDQPILIITGLSKIEMLNLQAEFDKASEPIVHKQISGVTFIKDHPNVHHEFVSAVIITIAITNVALKVLEIWVKNKSAPKPQKINIAVQLRDDTIIKIFNKSVTIEYPDQTKITINTQIKDDLKFPEKIKSYTELLKSVQEVFKEIKS
jgi:hypothetical protein